MTRTSANQRQSQWSFVAISFFFFISKFKLVPQPRRQRDGAGKPPNDVIYFILTAFHYPNAYAFPQGTSSFWHGEWRMAGMYTHSDR